MSDWGNNYIRGNGFVMHPSAIYDSHHIEIEIDNWGRFIGLSDYLKERFVNITGDVDFTYRPQDGRYILRVPIVPDTYNATCVSTRNTIAEYLEKGVLKIR